MNSAYSLKYIPFELFSINSLRELSLTHTDISWNSLSLYNNITNNSNILSSQFNWHYTTSYFLSLSPICSKNEEKILPNIFKNFINKTYCCKNTHCTNIADDNIGIDTSFCAPILWQDGSCDIACEHPIWYVISLTI